MRIQKDKKINPDDSEGPELFIARSGLLSARLNRNGKLLHLHSAIKPEDEAQCWGDLDFWGDLIVFLGTGLGYHLLQRAESIPPSARLLLVDFYPRFIEHCREKVFGRLDNTIDVICPDTPGWEGVAARASVEACKIQIIKHPASYHANKKFYDAVLGEIRFKRIRKTEEGPPLLFFGNFFLEEELRRALAQKAGRVALFNYTAMESCVRYESALMELVQRERPRFILSVNMKGFDANGAVSDITERLGVPLVIWFVDDPHPILLHQRQYVRNHHIALSWERSYCAWLERQGFGKSAYLPLAADPVLFDSAGEKRDLAQLGFVGSSMGRAFLSDLAARFLWKKEMEPVALSAARMFLENRGEAVDKILARACSRHRYTLPFSDARNITWLCSYIIHTASMLRRKELLTAAIPLGLHTFGDPAGWKELLGASLPAHPNIDYRTECASVYRSIDISINITSCQMPTAVNQRVFDVPLCGGFVLSDRQGDLDELFASDELAVYRSPEELLDKIAFYRDHPAERSRISSKARQRILSAHTYAHRVAKINELISA